MEIVNMKSIIGIILTLSTLTSYAEYFRPNSIKDLRATSVKVMNLKMTSGGTGSIYRSVDDASHILTNKHVCRLVEQGGYVVKESKKYLVTHYKKFKDHDLCLVRIAKNLGINLAVSDDLAKPADTVYVSGHPNLLPHIATKGHLSSSKEVSLIVAIEKCSAEDIKNDPLTCAFFRGKPVVESFSSQVVSNLIKPGS
jgi:S1-C subfamily serine protease